MSEIKYAGEVELTKLVLISSFKNTFSYSPLSFFFSIKIVKSLTVSTNLPSLIIDEKKPKFEFLINDLASS